MILEEYSGPGTFNPRNSTFLRSAYGASFGCFISDGSFGVSFIGFIPRWFCNNHRVWEIAIDLATIGAEPGDDVRIGIRTTSPSPSFTEDIPENFMTDFSELGQITLALSQLDPNPPSGAVLGIGSDGFEIEVTQAIQDADNSLPLVANKDTVVRVYPDVESDAMVRVFLFGEKDGLDLPGSPLVALAEMNSTIDRESLADTANFLLPNSWIDEGFMELTAVAENLDGTNTAVDSQLVNFVARHKPLYWIVPVNTGSANNPTLASNNEIASQESYLEAVFPVPDVNWVRRNWQDLGSNITTSLGSTNGLLNEYYNSAALAWVLSLLISGQEPFAMPEQIYGFTSTGGGLADSIWGSGTGNVASGWRGTSREGTMAHEINHNLDRNSNGTWGRHVGNPDSDFWFPNGSNFPPGDTDWGCGASGVDPNWPSTDDEIMEDGFVARLPWGSSNASPRAVIPDNYPDFMSYCQSASESNGIFQQLPTKWISPYRWNAIFQNFNRSSNPNQRSVQSDSSVYYVSGMLTVTGTGKLEPIKTMPGFVSDSITPGDYSLEVQDENGQILFSLPFSATFTNVEGEEVEKVYFHFQIPSQESGTRIVLKHSSQVLFMIEESPNPPLVVLTSPEDGDILSGLETIRWQASDDDGDPLVFTILYSPNDGDGWYPVASAITETEYTVDVGLLPGGSGGKIQVIATDGFNTVQALSSGTFEVPHPAPTVVINSPADAQSYQENEWIDFSGYANDLYGSSSDNFVYIWSIDGQDVEVGQEASVRLTEGEYEVMLTAYDDQGSFGQALVTITVVSRPTGTEVYLPILQR